MKFFRNKFYPFTTADLIFVKLLFQHYEIQSETKSRILIIIIPGIKSKRNGLRIVIAQGRGSLRIWAYFDCWKSSGRPTRTRGKNGGI